MPRRKLSPLEWMESQRRAKRKYYQKTKAKERQRSKDYYWENRDEILAAQKERRALAREEYYGIVVRKAEIAARPVKPLETPAERASGIAASRKVKGNWHEEVYMNDTIPTDTGEDALYGQHKPEF